MTQGLHRIPHKTWNSLNFTAKQKSFFVRKWKHFTNSKGKVIGGEFVFEFTKPWMFELKVEPNFITHQLVINPKIESELKELYNRIEKNNLWPKIGKLLGWDQSDDWEDIRKKLVERILEKDLKMERSSFLT
ncbi:MAG: hypothetical protein IAF38_08375 [Bacteroidia bacterium]|nr:hypothetical protein [Bacteroidia bacterium]